MTISTQFKQSHFILYELILPYCSVCTPTSDYTESWHTPVTCEESSDSTYSLWFTRNSSPLMSPPSTSIDIKSRLNSSVWRCVSSASESTGTLKPGDGMASRGSMSITFDDFRGDPGPINFTENGTFFGKLKARNILDGKKITSYYYSITQDSIAPILTKTSTHFIEKATLTGGKFSISAKDALKDLEAFSQKIPVPTESKLTIDIDDSTTTIPVSDGSLYSVGGVVIIDKELIRIASISGNVLTSYTRGADYNGVDSLIYKTEAKSHSIDATVQICYVMNKTFLSNALQDIYDSIGLTDYVNFPQWDDEISNWNENAWLNGVLHTPRDADKVINQMLSNYMIDMWLDADTQKVTVSATTSWKQSIRTISEDNDFTGLTTSTSSNTRFSRAYIYNNKEYQAENDDETNYSQLTLYKDTSTESADLYGSIKVKESDPSPFISPDSAFIWASRYVQRFSRTPQELSFRMEERKLGNSGLGDVVDIITRDSQTASGDTLESRVRSQIIEIKPRLNDIGRSYDVKALSYVPLIASTPGGDLTIFISGTVFDINLYARAGAPPDALTVTFVFDAAIIGSTSNTTPSIRAGAFDPSTVIKLIFINNCEGSSIGGNGGSSYTNSDNDIVTTTNATDGGDFYSSDGIESHLYLNYGTVDTYDTSGLIYAAGGGGGSASAEDSALIGTNFYARGAGASGGGGSGIPGGLAGIATKKANPNVWVEDVINNGINGSLGSAGSGVFSSSSFGTVIATSTSGAGGASLDGISSSGSSANGAVSIGGAGLAGGAIKGSNVTLYNLAVSSGKFKAGNSDSFTLITS